MSWSGLEQHEVGSSGLEWVGAQFDKASFIGDVDVLYSSD